ncbi:DUF3883 domain-containing protein [Methanocalculus sp.]|uniref:protein NO VEIN domain-containing protein n=1 Tax=Methanocalculus sp. TaxID=2004547 RepID=UPI002611B67E|nr:DUF3883 domain-containing protein [Methanocalculus sp.]MDG6250258.1 DUF3883 domain-containing protein [Methanocalculus sp.]
MADPLANNIFDTIKPRAIIKEGPHFPEDVEVLTVKKVSESLKIECKGRNSSQVYTRFLTPQHINQIEIFPECESFTGDAKKFRLGIEAKRLGLAYEYDPYFSLSIARIDPLPHQLEAVYDYFLNLPRIRFLLADDPGAGKTIMAGLLIKELKIRGLVKRILIVTPANLTFQWQRELKEKFREEFHIVRGEILRAAYGSNPWDERDQVVTSLPWIARIDEAQESLLKSKSWDLIIVDEAHKMSAYSEEKKTLAYRIGERLSEMTDHYLLMTATPHKGDKENFRLFLSLLDKDVYGDIQSLLRAMEAREAPFYLRRVKEALVNFPDPETGKVTSLFRKRFVYSVSFDLDAEEGEFYQHLTDYVEDQSVRAAAEGTIRGRALGFTMAMLQRRFASSIYAVRCSLERMRDKRQEILRDPEAYRKKEIDRRLQRELDKRFGSEEEILAEFYDDERERLLLELEEAVISYRPEDLREEIADLSRLVTMAKHLEEREIETKLLKLKEQLTAEGIFQDPNMKLLVFTEHKDTLVYLVEKLRSWGLSVTQIHGGMKIGDRNTPGTRLNAEKEFRDDCQVMVATEAAGEGINLQFCWFMINYDIPWNPVRLEQRMGRIHRYGQEKDCLIYNFVARNTREGRVMDKLFSRISQIEDDLDPERTGKIFNVLGDVFPSNQIERKLREMYAQSLEEQEIISWIIDETEKDRFSQITNSTLEGLAKRHLNLSAIIGKREEAKERRLVPDVVADFFATGGGLCGLSLRETKEHPAIFRVGKVPRLLIPIGEEIERVYGTLGREYREICFDKEVLRAYPNTEWVTPGHPLFESVRHYVLDETEHDLRSGAVFFDLHRDEPAVFDVFSAAVNDGLNNTVHERLFVLEHNGGGEAKVRQPTVFLDVIPANAQVTIPEFSLPGHDEVEALLYEHALMPFMEKVADERRREVGVIRRHLETSLQELLMRENTRNMELHKREHERDPDPLLPANIANSDRRLDELERRLKVRRAELLKEETLTIGNIRHHGRAWVLPHPDRNENENRRIRRSDEIERIAIKAAIAYENARGYDVESVEDQNCGYDLKSRKFDPDDPDTAVDLRFIEVKGRAGVDDVYLSDNEYKTAVRQKEDYWLYVVYNCATNPVVYPIRNPAKLGWQPVVRVEHYQIGSEEILEVNK